MSLTPFEKGKSGNPGGRPKVDPAVIGRLRELCPDAVNRLAEIVANPSHKDHFRAIENVLNRVLGMPKQPIGLTDDDEATHAIAGSLAKVMALLDGAIRGGKTSDADANGVASPSPRGSDPA